VPIGLFVAFMAPRVLGESKQQKGIALDLPGALTATAGLASLVYGLTHAAGSAQESNWGKTSTWFWIVLGAVLIVAFLVTEGRTRQPLMPLHVLRHRSRGVSYLAMLIVGAAVFAFFFFISLFVQQVLGYSSIKAGVAFLPFTLGIGISAQLASTLISRIDPRYLATFGAGLATVGMITFTRLTVDSGYWSGLLPGILLTSLGMGFLFIPFTLTATHGVSKDESGIASAVLNTAQQMGGAVGLAALSTVSFGVFRDKIKPELLASQGHPSQHAIAVASTHGYTVAFWVATVMILSAGVITLLGLSIKHQELATDEPVVVGA
jgi:predicted MFS family arabinose efflux permease